MALPRINSDPAAVDRVASVWLVTPATTIAEAQSHLHATGEDATVVQEGGRPVGVVTTAALAGALARHGPDTPIAMVMDYVAVPVDPQADTYKTLRAFRRTAWDWLEHRQP